MAMIQIINAEHGAAVQLSEPDEDGDYGWRCTCGVFDDDYRPVDEAIAHAEVHVDIQHGDS